MCVLFSQSLSKNICLYPVNMPDLIQKHFGSGHYGQHAARIRPESISQIQLPTSVSALFFQRRHGSYCAKPPQIRSGWPGQGLAKHTWSGSKLVCRNHRAQFLAGCNWPATRFPLSDSVPFFQTSQIILSKTSPDLIQFWLTVSGFGQMDPARKQASMQESSSPLLVNASQLIWTGCKSDPSCLLGKQLFWGGSHSVLSLFKQHKYLDVLCVCDPRSIKF